MLNQSDLKCSASRDTSTTNNSDDNVAFSKKLIMTTVPLRRRRLVMLGGSECAFVAVLLLLLPLIACPASAQYNVERSDPFAMLSATLQTYQGSHSLSRFARFLNQLSHYLSVVTIMTKVEGRIRIAFSKMQDEFVESRNVIESRCVQEASCDGQTLSLECPIGTKIAIHFVQYGRAAPSSQVRTRYGKRPEGGHVSSSSSNSRNIF